MPAVSAMTPKAPAPAGQDLELEHAELLPARETLMIAPLLPHWHYSPGINPGGPMYPAPGPFHAGWRE